MHEYAVGAVAAIDAEWSARLGRDAFGQLKDLLERLNESLERDVHGALLGGADDQNGRR